MDKELKTKWVAALRSGNYEQTTGTLKVEHDGGEGYPLSYCCLGVLLCVTGTPHARMLGPRGHDPHYRFIESLIGREARYDLQSMNDQGCRSFAHLADYIESAL